MKTRTLSTLAALAAVTLATPAMAHTGAGHTSGLAAGLAHPLLGLDHLLAMVAVGAWSAVAMPRRLWAGPLAFMAAMLAGAGLAFLGVALPAVEATIALSLLVLGLMLAVPAKLGSGAALALIAAFALAHGHAHGSEAAGGALAYLVGMLIATAMLHAAGAAAGFVLLRSRLALAVGGGAVAASGLALMAF